MSAALRIRVGMLAAGLSYLVAVGYAQAQQVEEQIKPAQYADQDTGQPVSDQDSSSPVTGQQQSTTYFRGPDSARANASGAGQSLDYYLASCLAIKNQAEIEANEFGAQKAESDEVKEFAQQMIQDHRELAQQLEQLTGSSSSRTQTSDRGTSTSRTSNATASTSDSGDELSQLLEIDRQITDRCSQMVREKLEQKSGAEFDRCFVGAQIGNHIHMLAALEVISQKGGNELQQTAREAKSTVESHLQHAEELAEKLQAQAGSQSVREARRE